MNKRIAISTLVVSSVIGTLSYVFSDSLKSLVPKASKSKASKEKKVDPYFV